MIVIDDEEYANQIVEQYKPDFLFEIEPDAQMSKFVDSHKELPFIRGDESTKMWYDSGLKRNQQHQYFASIGSILKRHIFNPGDLLPKHFKWNSEDRLADVFRATFGEFPTLADTAIDYSHWFEKEERAFDVVINIDEVLSRSDFDPNALTINCITTLELEEDFMQSHSGVYGEKGLYIGDPTSFDDIVSYWNLRAFGVEAIFFPVSENSRVLPAICEFLNLSDSNSIQENDRTDFSVWYYKRERSDIEDVLHSLKAAASEIVPNRISDFCKIFSPHSQVPFLSTKVQSVIVPIVNSDRGQSFQVLVPPKPLDEKALLQKVMLSMRIEVNEKVSDECTFNYPDLRQMNEFYGLNLTDTRTHWWRVRVQRRGISVLLYGYDPALTIKALGFSAFLKEFFKQSNIEYEISRPGLLVVRMLEQLGGMGWTRLFKIPSVRDLIEKHPAEKWFSHAEALSTLSGKHIDKPLKEQNIRISNDNELTGVSVLRSLLERTVLRIGMELKCPHCELNFWISLDRVQTKSECALCGRSFDITSQITNQNWSYRTSGIFAYRKDQGGAIPVSLAMNYLIHSLYSAIGIQSRITSWCANLKGKNNLISPCELDLAFFIVREDGIKELILAECKGGKNIEVSDFENLQSVAHQIERADLQVYLLFSKLTAFTSEELAFMKEKCNHLKPRIILLTDEELQSPHWLTEARKVGDSESSHLKGFEEMAQKSYEKYLRTQNRA